MITKTIKSEFDTTVVAFNHGYPVGFQYICIDAYRTPDQPSLWMRCPCCNLKPKIWEFNNGRSTACGCGHSRYDHFSVYAESVMSCHMRSNGKPNDYSVGQLRHNWNEYCSTMINPCNHADLCQFDRW